MTNRIFITRPISIWAYAIIEASFKINQTRIRSFNLGVRSLHWLSTFVWYIRPMPFFFKLGPFMIYDFFLPRVVSLLIISRNTTIACVHTKPDWLVFPPRLIVCSYHLSARRWTIGPWHRRAFHYAIDWRKKAKSIRDTDGRLTEYAK